MIQSGNKVLRHLAGNENIDEVSFDELEKFVDESPYFAVGHLLLSKKLKAGKSDHFLNQAQKTALYFSNTYWLHYQLSDESWQNKFSQENLLNKKENKVEELINSQRDEASIGLADVIVSEDRLPLQNQLSEAQVNKEEIELNGINETRSSINFNDNKAEEVNQPEEEMAAISRNVDPSATEFLSEISSKEEVFNQDNSSEVILENPTPVALETGELIEGTAAASTETEAGTEEFLQQVQVSGEHSEKSAAENIKQTSESSDNQKFIEDVDILTYKNEDSANQPDEHERMFQNIKAMLDATAEEADAGVDNAVVPIDPYYTIDYFASQGIKLELDPHPKDQLGQHLKKFTQWLKHMKKLGPEDAAEVITRADTEADIQKIAESSNTAREVVTEAMASVLEKQGKNDKAIELYKKLSFLNHDKSAYFAAKIKNLKGI